MSIEKFSGRFKNEARGCTVIINSTIQAVTKFDVLGLYVYLCSKPETWAPNAKELMRHTGCSKEKIYRLIKDLLATGLMTVCERREGGRFAHYEYTVHLHPVTPCPKNQDTVDLDLDSPCPGFTDTVKPDAVNQDAYKEKTIERKDRNKEVEGKSVDTHPVAIQTLKKYEIKVPIRNLNQVTRTYIQKAIDLLAKRDLTLDDYLDYLTVKCPRRLLPYISNGKERQNGFGNILRPSFITDTLTGSWED